MYLSQLTLNPYNRDAQRDIAHAYELHKTLTTCCFHEDAIHAQHNTARADAQDAHGLLFRLDTDPRNNRLVLLAQSQIKPNWDGLPAGYALDICGPKDFDLTHKLAADQAFRFRLRASPTKRIGNSTPYKQDIGKRVGIKDEQEQMNWLARKGEQHGFKVMRVQINEQTTQYGKKAGYTMQWLSVCFDGVLTVQDPTQLQQAVECGIGTAKGMGFGLLSLSRIPSPVRTGEG